MTDFLKVGFSECKSGTAFKKSNNRKDVILVFLPQNRSTTRSPQSSCMQTCLWYTCGHIVRITCYRQHGTASVLHQPLSCKRASTVPVAT
jgi:hypothetical protein